MAVVKCAVPETLDSIYRGNTGPVLQPRPTVLDDGVILAPEWTCYIGANYEDGSEAVAKTEVLQKTADNLRWIAALTPTQTEALVIPSGLDCINIDLIIEVANATTVPPFKVELHYTLSVLEQGMV